MVAELSDLSFGDAWVGEYSKDTSGTSMVICRSERGETLLSRAIEKGAISLQPVARDRVLWSTKQVTKFKKSLPARASLLKRLGKKVPDYVLTFPKSGIGAYTGSLSGQFRMYLGRRRFLWGPLWYMSGWSSRPKSLAIKTLKTIGLYKIVARVVRGF